MRIVRVKTVEGAVEYGLESENRVDRLEGDLYGQFSRGQECLNPEKRLVPVEPVAIYAIGLNYRAHAAEMQAEFPDYPVVFMKSTTSVLNPDDPIVLPRHLPSDRVDYECELAVVIGRKCKNVPVEAALDYVLGYSCANDITARDWQKFDKGAQWTKAKSFDTFCPIGPALITADCIPNPQILPIRTYLNGETRQESSTGDMIFTVAELISFLSGSTTLLPGTVILTGTPAGIGMADRPPRFLKPGDEVVVEIPGIGRLRNPVCAENVCAEK